MCGLSFSKFRYSDILVSRMVKRSGCQVHANVTVTNIGSGCTGGGAAVPESSEATGRTANSALGAQRLPVVGTQQEEDVPDSECACLCVCAQHGDPSGRGGRLSLCPSRSAAWRTVWNG